MTTKQQQVESLNNDIQILQKKLESKSKAFAILINELDSLKHERDQFKTLADSLQEKCVQLKKQINTKIEPLASFHSSQPVNDFVFYSSKEKESTIHLLKSALKTIQDEKEVLQTRIDDLTRELNDVKGDLSIFRQKRHLTRGGNHSQETDIETKSNSIQHQEEENRLLQRLEKSNEKINQLENDLKLIVCQKEELEIERDSFKTKYLKLNQELNKMLNGNEKQIIDIELILSENRFLKEKVNELTQEKNLAQANVMKYKDLLQNRRSAYNDLGKVQSSGNILTHKQVRSLINQSYLVPTTPETEQDLRSIAEALYENLKDKNVTITHQRKTNKILANRVAELEKLLAENSLASKSDQTNSLMHLLDSNSTSQFVNSIDEHHPTSPSQIFNFPSTWPSSPPSSSSTRTFDEDLNLKTKDLKQTTFFKSTTLDCRQSRRTSARSESIELEMDDPLHSPPVAPALAYLEEQDLIPPIPSKSDDIRSTTTNLTC